MDDNKILDLTPEEKAKRQKEYKVQDEVENMLKKGIEDGTAIFDANGHFSSPHHFEWTSYLKEELHLSFIMSTLEEIQTLKQQIESGKGDTWIQLQVSGINRCWGCDKRLAVETNGRNFRIMGERCDFPNGVPPIEFDLNIPSGIMIVTNDLRDKFRIIGSYNVNANVGCLKTSLAYANVGMAHCFVGNTCPSMYRIKDTDRFVIGVSGKRNPAKNSLQVASICTDLWWFSIVDGAEFERRYNLKIKDIKKDMRLDVVKCNPGLYHFKHVHHLRKEKWPCIYTYIRRKGKALPERDFKAEWGALDYTAGQIVADAIHNWPSYGIQRVADHILCCIGNGYDAHPNGWLGACPDINTSIPPVEIPEFNRKFHWYPLCDYSFLACAAGLNPKGGLKETINLNSSFLDMAFKICRSIINYGVDDHHGDGKENHCICQEVFGWIEKEVSWDL